MNILAKLVELADSLDKKGLTVEADQVDGIIQEAKGFWCDKHDCMKKECGCSMKTKKKDDKKDEK